ncbi:hypothetical protein, partial [Mycobacterium tuberculosis]
LNKDGIPEVWPFAPAKHRAMLANLHPEEYDLRRYAAVRATSRPQSA